MTTLGSFDVPGYYVGDCRELLRQLPDACVDCCVTSPPYWGLRDYGEEGQLVRCRIFYDPDERDSDSDVKVAVSVCFVPGVTVSEPPEGSKSHAVLLSVRARPRGVD